MKEKIVAKLKSKSFWTAAAGALTLLLSAFGIKSEVAQAIASAVGGVLVALGIVAAPCGKTEKTKEEKPSEEASESDNAQNKSNPV